MDVVDGRSRRRDVVRIHAMGMATSGIPRFFNACYSRKGSVISS